VVNGVIAVAGARFTGRATVINGSIINHSTNPIELQGQSSLSFNQSGRTNNPAGFTAEQVVQYNAASYSRVR
jgi:hypothetical protein